MSRVYGRAFDVYSITKLLKETKINEYKKDNKKTTWTDIEYTPEKIITFLPDCAIDFLAEKKVKIMKTPFLKYTTTQIPDTEEQDRFIKFPSLVPKEEFKRELMFYMGMILANYNGDNDSDEYEIPDEYDDTLPFLLEYIYLKVAGKDDKFIIKHLNELKSYQKNYMFFYDDYKDFEDLKSEAEFANLDKIRYEKFQKLCKDKEDEISSLTKDSVSHLSSLEGTLAIIDSCKSEEELKRIIEELMLNKKGNRGIILRDREIESYGYKRLRKEIEKNRK